MLYRDMYEKADREERRGNNLEAARLFYGIAEEFSSMKITSIKARHKAAINLRLGGNLQDADSAFKVLLRDPEAPPKLRAQMLRDHGMVFFDQGKLDKALSCFQSSTDQLESQGHRDEAAISRGFEARFYAAIGLKDDALSHYRAADEVLRASEQRVPEMNNLVWYMKSASVWLRVRLFVRTFRLARETEHPRRAIEAVIILGSPHLYQSLKKV